MLPSAVGYSAELAYEVNCEHSLRHEHRPVISAKGFEHAHADPDAEDERHPGEDGEGDRNTQHFISPAVVGHAVGLDGVAGWSGQGRRKGQTNARPQRKMLADFMQTRRPCPSP